MCFGMMKVSICGIVCNVPNAWVDMIETGIERGEAEKALQRTYSNEGHDKARRRLAHAQLAAESARDAYRVQEGLPR